MSTEASKDDKTLSEKIGHIQNLKIFECWVFFKHRFPLLEHILNLKMSMLTMTRRHGVGANTISQINLWENVSGQVLDRKLTLNSPLTFH